MLESQLLRSLKPWGKRSRRWMMAPREESETIRSRLSSKENHPSSPSTKAKKEVTFDKLHIRSHNIILGDHPYCSDGCPMELDWDYVDETEVSVDQFEATRLPRKSRTNMRTTWQERHDCLSETDSTNIAIPHSPLLRSRKSHDRDLAAFFQLP